MARKKKTAEGGEERVLYVAGDDGRLYRISESELKSKYAIPDEDANKGVVETLRDSGVTYAILGPPKGAIVGTTYDGKPAKGTTYGSTTYGSTTYGSTTYGNTTFGHHFVNLGDLPSTEEAPAEEAPAETPPAEEAKPKRKKKE